jgi:ribose-phosphate pyrophosphokinase
MNPIRLVFDGRHQQIENSIVFPGGEVHVNAQHLPDKCSDFIVRTWLQTSEDVMQMLMVCDILKNKYPDARFALDIGYMPYARQDRVCAEGDAFSFRVFVELLNTINPDVLYTRDLHSRAAFHTLAHGLTSEVRVHHQLDAIKNNVFLSTQIKDSDILIVSPDKGAQEKATHIASTFGCGILYGEKVRDAASGKLSGFQINIAGITIKDRVCLIVDDICDGGGTFLGLAEELLKHEPKEIWLYVTHGIFSKGLEIFDNKINKIFTTDTIRDNRYRQSTPLTKFHFIHV